MTKHVRIEGPDPPGPWDTNLVFRWMVAQWRADRRETFDGRPSTVHEAGSWCALYLPVAHPMRDRARDFLLARVWAEAGKHSFRELCDGRTWSRATALRWSEWALDRIAAGLNEAQRPPAP